MKKIWHEIEQFIRLVSVGKRKILPIMTIGAFMTASLPFLALYFSAQIMNQVIVKDYGACKISVAILLISQLICGLIARACSQSVIALQESCDQNVKQRLAAKAFELEYEEFEKQETMDSIRRCNISSSGAGGIGAQVDQLYHIITNIFMILYSFVFVMMLFLKVDVDSKNFFTSYSSTIVLLLIYVVILAMTGKVGKKVESLFHDLLMKNDHVNAMADYINNAIMNERNAKDIRVFKMQKMLDEMLRATLSKSLGMYLTIGSKAAVYHCVIAFLTQIAAGFSYIFVGAKAIYGIIYVSSSIS